MHAQPKRWPHILPLLLLLTLQCLLTACQRPEEDVPTLVQSAQQTTPLPPTPPITPSPGADTVRATATLLPITPSPEATATPTPFTLGASPAVPPDLVAEARALVDAHPGRFAWAEGAAADVTLDIGQGEPLARWVYAVAVPFATVEESVPLAALKAGWQAGGGSAGTPLLTAQTEALLRALWGDGQAEIVPDDGLVEALWRQRPSWSLVPFQRLTPDLKVLAVEGVSPLDRSFEPSAYPLSISVGARGAGPAVTALVDLWTAPGTNRDPQKITRVAMTGVTALVRATAYQMEIRSLLYPGEEVAPIMQAADIAHVSNEVSFVAGCPYPHYLGDPVFCSDPRYLALLEEIGVDVVELTGNHLNDWGREHLPYTLNLYDEAGMVTFGGGRTLDEARAPALFEHNGNRIAFVGCNPVGPAGAWATAEWAGALPCDYGAFKAQIGQLRDEGYLVIATQQYRELYNYAPSASQRADFRALAAAGAAAVSGSQGHHAQGFDFHDGAFIHYGLGNLFFDQMDQQGTRQTLVDRYVIYEGRLLSVELWTGLIENYARPRLMTADERAQLLRTLFQASGW